MALNLVTLKKNVKVLHLLNPHVQMVTGGIALIPTGNASASILLNLLILLVKFMLSGTLGKLLSMRMKHHKFPSSKLVNPCIVMNNKDMMVIL